jgi:DNA-binding NarL/FixJ family response regulator
MDKINVLIVDDEALLREGMRSLLEKETFIQSISEASDADEFQYQITQHSFDIILLDMRLRKSSGLDILKTIKVMPKEPKVIAVTGLDGVELIVNLLKGGVHGVVYKLDGYSEIIKAINAIAVTGSYFPESILKIIRSNVQRWDSIPSVTLSFQEKELLRAIAGGSTTKEIASDLKMSPATTETYRIRLMKKLGVPNTAALLAYAYRNGIL